MGAVTPGGDDVTSAAIVLAGGRGSRLGGVRKADLVVGGRRLLDVVLEACAGCDPIVVVGEEDLVVPRGVVVTREDPPFSGPASALAAGLAILEGHGARAAGPEPGWVLCLGCDQPGAPAAVPALIDAAATAPPEVDAISACAPSDDPGSASHPTPPTPSELREETSDIRREPPDVRVGEGDSGQRIEWTLAILRIGALRAAVAAQGGPNGAADLSMRRLLGALRWASTPVAAYATDDIDTWDDHARWQQRMVPR